MLRFIVPLVPAAASEQGICTSGAVTPSASYSGYCLRRTDSREPYSSVYFEAVPRARSTGYLRALASILSAAACSRSISSFRASNKR